MTKTRARQGLPPTIADDPVGIELAARFLTSAAVTAVEPSPATELAAVTTGAVGPRDTDDVYGEVGVVTVGPSGESRPAAPHSTTTRKAVSS